MAQSAPQTTTIPALNSFPVSTEASSFLKYGDVPVGLYTGIPDIKIPIYTLSMKGIEIPITLSYYAGGIKVDELASNVGIGWSLNVGGAISSTVHGKPDYHGWLTETKKTPQIPSNLQTSWGVSEHYQTDNNYKFLLDASKGIIDTQPDIFHVNMNGRSFKYYYDQNHNIFTIPYQRVKFENDWTIIDENDTKFTYAIEDLVSTNNSHSGGDEESDPSNSYYSSYLSEVVTANNDSILYEYENYSYNFKNQISETRFLSFSQYGCQPMPRRKNESETFVVGQRIKKITGNNGVEVNFTYDLLRRDLPGTHALTGIFIRNKNTGIILSSYTLIYEYFTSGGNTPDDHRLKLISVEKAGENAYYFEYQAGLPARLSMGQDHWGYFNGSGGTTLLPVDNALGFYTGATREPNEVAAKAGILTKIKYPTGGYTAFNYESNQYLESGITRVIGGLRIKSISDYPLIGNPKTKHFKYLSIGNHLPTPQYIYTVTQRQINSGEGSATDCTFYAQSSASIEVLGGKGGSLNYSNVEVYTDDKTKGYTHHNFSSFGGHSGSPSYPFAPLINYDWVDGLPLETTDYLWDSEIDNYSPVKKVINQYKTAYGRWNNNLSKPHESELWGMKVVLQTYPIPLFPPSYDPRGPEFLVLYYSLFSSWCYPIKTTEILYNSTDTTQKIITETNLYYDNPAHINVTRTEVTKSKGEKYNILYRYPQDYNPQYPYNASPIVEKRIMINTDGVDRLVGAELTTYLSQPGAFPRNYYNLNITSPMSPTSVPLYTGGSINGLYEKRREYQYDSKYNIVSFISDSLKFLSFKWGYNNQYPIVEVKNATQNEFYSENFEESNNFDSNITRVTGEQVHTGKFSGKIVAIGSSKVVSHSNWIDIPSGKVRRYRYSGWVYSSGPQTELVLFMKRKNETGYYSYVDSKLNNNINKWVYIEKEVDVNADVTMLSVRLDNNGNGAVWFDDLRILPANAQMKTYTFDPLTGMTSQIDENGQTTYYEYDALQRLNFIKDRDRNTTKTYEYHYKQ